MNAAGIDGSPFEIWKNVITTKFADFSGRARRKEYWWFTAVNIGIVIGLQILAAILGSISDGLALIPVLLLVVIGLATLIPGIALAVRRLHDTGKSGWFLLIAIIPLLGSLILLFFMVSDSDKGTNNFGVSPKYGA